MGLVRTLPRWCDSPGSTTHPREAKTVLLVCRKPALQLVLAPGGSSPLGSAPRAWIRRCSPSSCGSPSVAREAPPARAPSFPARSCISEGTTKSLLAGPFAISGEGLQVEVAE